MRSTSPMQLEPDLLRVFRLFMIWQAVMLMVWSLLQSIASEPAVLRYQLLAAIVPAMLILFCSWAKLQQALGRAYLPLALGLAAVGQLVVYAVIVRWRIADGVAPDTLIRDAWLLIIALLLPAILVAWQYGMSAMIWFCVLSVAIDLALMLPIAGQGGPPIVTIVAVALVRVLFFLPVGYAVARLVAAQRAQREALAAANERLARHAATLEQLATSRERNRLARELHDTLAHTLAGLAVQLEAINAVWSSQGERARAMLREVLGMTRQGLAEARRAIKALRAAPLADLGLIVALRELARSVADRSGLALDLHLPDALDELPAEHEQALYRIAEEALSNVVRHAAASRVTLDLSTVPGVRLTIADDGCGFDATQDGAADRYGLRGMRERAELIGARLDVSSDPGNGTTIRLFLRGKS